VCRWHSPDPEDVARHLEESKRGGDSKAYRALASLPPLGDDPEIAALDLSTANGLKRFTAATLRALSRLPFDVRIANAIGQIILAQRTVIETSDLEDRLVALEVMQPGVAHG
jgi:hypothetical protein